MTLVVGGKEIATKPLRVSGDSVMPMSDADRKTWHDTTLSLHQPQQAANDAADAVTTLGTQLDGGVAAEDGGRQRQRQQAGSRGGRQAARGPAAAAWRRSDRRRGRRLRRRPEPERAGAHRPAEGADHGVHVPADRDADRSATEAREDLTKVAQVVNDLIGAVPQLCEKLGANGLKPAALKAVTIP